MAFGRAQRAREDPHENDYQRQSSATARHPRLYRAQEAAPAGEPGGGALRRYHHIAIGLVISDAACIVLALLSSYFLRYSGRPMPGEEIAVIVLTPLLWCVVFQTFDLYATQH